MKRLNKLIKDIEIERIYGDINKEINGICYDSRKAMNNYIFVCIKGFQTDGHKYIDGAIKNGVSVVIIEREIINLDEVINKGITVIKVKNSRRALSKISANYYDHPSKKINVVGVTGTNGKTSITNLLNTILETNNKRSALLGTINNKILKKIYKSKNTTPESLELHELFHEMVSKKIEVCTMEVSSHSLDLFRVDDVEFNIGIFTNLTRDHLDYHKDMEDYKNAKIKLFYKASMANIINMDDKYGREILKEINKLDTPIFTYGLTEKSDFFAKDIKMFPSYSEFILVTPSYSTHVKMNIPGVFSIYNILAVIASCYVLGLSKEEILKGIRNIKPIKGRFELVENDLGKTVIIDYAHTPDALKNVLDTIKQFTAGKIIVVFGCGGDRDNQKRPMMGQIASNLADYIILTNDNPRTENPDNIISDILDGIKKEKNNFDIIKNRKEAIKKAIKMATQNDTVLIAGKGHESYQIIGDKVFDFDDKEVAMEFLKEDIV